jgi:hypothetical protein
LKSDDRSCPVAWEKDWNLEKGLNSILYESGLWNTGIRPVFVDDSYLVIIEGAYGYHRHQWESLVGRRRSLNWSDSWYHVTYPPRKNGSKIGYKYVFSGTDHP